VSPHVSTFVEQFERSFGSIQGRPVSGLPQKIPLTSNAVDQLVANLLDQ